MPKSKTDNTPKEEKTRKDKSGHKRKSTRSHKKHGSSSRKSRQGELDGAIELYCAVYTPRSGNHYHWAFVMYHSELGWCLYEVVQQVDDGPFTAVFRQTDPRSSSRCLPLIHLGSMHADYARQLPAAINGITVPGEAAMWNCQDYVLEIWDAVLGIGAIDEVIWGAGRDNMIPYYGPIQDNDNNEDEGEDEDEEGSDDGEGQTRQYQSAEFVYDSDSD
ncbi:hypothetical protein B0J13DRAFT_165771 [Dactylonectria estremocensis]|uniref:Uncharacterized protein n=1 Tax=Dactylonectria estremocensis TaxID=1079267 RepID=A0A9P9I5M6_9HYPO|nr:hypothetical protein B0J13DRAFT_333060 [Dactylonectria estremocensis]KAH7120130.1 hypothetical protein B0J13DRAFT_165771 [Dactylonectria estremocensis]